MSDSDDATGPRAGGEVVRFDSPFLRRSDVEEVPAVSALVVLNSPVSRPPSRVFLRLWEASTFRVCADGGANRLHEATFAGGERETGTDATWVPDLIRGDLDSLRPDVRSHYESVGCRVERDPDQDTNDLDKALQAVRAERDRRLPAGCAAGGSDGDPVPAARVFVYGAFGGRFDQEMASLQALYRWAEVFRHKMFLYSDETCAFLLPSRVHNEIRLPLVTTKLGLGGEDSKELPSVGEGPTCGIIPLGGRCESVLTTGLEWNLDGTTALEFGGLVSTSNRIIEDVVTVQASHPVIFTAEVLH